jgi:hypothetical protein
LHVCRPIDNTTVRVVGGKAEARTVEGQHADVEARGNAVKGVGFESGTGKAVEIEERCAVGTAVFCVAQGTAVGENEGLSVCLGHYCTFRTRTQI